MKKFLLTLFCMITFTSLSAKEITETFDFSKCQVGTQYAEEVYELSDNVTITIVGCHINTQLRIYSNSTNNGFVVSNKLPGTIKSMSFNVGYKEDSLDVYGSNDGSTWNKVGSISTTTSYKDSSINFSSSYTYFKLDVAGTNQLRIKSMSITYEVSDSGGGEENTPVDLTDEQFKWSDATAVATIGATNTFPELTNTENVPVEYSSSKTSVATIDAERGEITLVGAGETEISAVSTATEDYNSKAVTYTLTVNPASSGGEEGETVTWVAETDTDNPGNSKDWLSDNIDAYTTWTATKGGSNNPKYYDTGKGLRVYNGGTFTITSSRIISSITLTFASSSYTFSANNTNATQTVNPYSYTYEWSVTRTCRLQKIEITYATAAVETRVSEVTFSPKSGEITAGTEVTLECATEGASIYYTLDNSEPTSASTLYSKPIVVNEALTIKAVAKLDDVYSDVTEATYTINDGSYFELVTSLADLNDGNRIIITNSDANQSMGEITTNNIDATGVTCDNKKINPSDAVLIITLESAGTEGKFYLHAPTGYLYAGSSDSNQLKIKSTKDDNCIATISIADEKATIKFSESGITRNWLRYNSSSTLFSCYSSGQEDIKIFKEIGRPEAPTFTYENVDEKRMEFDEIGVAYIHAQDGCTIYYTIDGNDPTKSSTEYDGKGVYVDTDTTIKAVAVSANGVMSDVAEVTLILFVPEGVKYTKVNSFNETMTRQSNSNAGGYGFILCGEIDGTLYVMSTQSGSNVIKATEADIRVDGNIYLVGDDHNHYEFYINNSGNGNYYLWSKEGDNVNVISTDVETNSLYLESIANAEANGHVYLCEITNATSQPVSSAMHKAVSGNEVDIVFDNKNTLNLIGLYRDDVNGHYFGANTILADEPFEKVYLYASEDGQTTGVENVIDELTNNHAEVEFYNLQGVRVDKPAAGIYIRRQGNTAVKILVK